ncbi:MAG: Fe(3+) ABC transporter substrate-binding protein [Phototrophicales bacterium]
MKRFILLVMLLVVVSAVQAAPAQQDNGVLYIYSSRHYGAMEAPFVAFEQATGIEIRLHDGTPQALLERLRAEGDRSPADLFLAIDAGVLDKAAEEGLLQPVESEILTENIAPEFRDPDNYWFGLSIRARTAVYNTEAVTEDELENHLNTYADLADPIWEGRLCMRPASHIYTVSLVSGLIYNLGEEEATEVVAGWVANNPTYINSDTRMIQAVAAGECDVALVNHYYMGRLVSSEDPAVENVVIRWLNQDTTGVFFNINGAGVTANARNYENAVRFIEFMSSLEGQSGAPEGFPGSNFEYPTNPQAEWNETIASFGEFILDTNYPLNEYGNYQDAAVTLLEETGYGFDES